VPRGGGEQHAGVEWQWERELHDWIRSCNLHAQNVLGREGARDIGAGREGGCCRGQTTLGGTNHFDQAIRLSTSWFFNTAAGRFGAPSADMRQFRMLPGVGNAE